MEASGYVRMLRESLEKKNRILDEIIDENLKQMDLLRDPNCTPEQLEATFDVKADLVDAMESLDDGFSEVFSRVEEEMGKNRSKYKDEIVLMKSLIRDITDKAARIQSMEEEGNRLATQKFTYIKEQVQKVHKSQQAVNSYYKNMMRVNYVDPQFLDNKK